MSWFYISPTQERLPFAESEIPILVRSGVLQAQTQVWRPEQDSWLSASEVEPGWFRAATGETATSGAASILDAVAPLLRHRAWFVVTGVFLVLTSLVVLVGCIMAVMGDDTFVRAITFTLFPCSILWAVGGIGMIRSLAQLARGLDLRQPSVLEEGFQKLGRAVTQIGIGILITVLLLIVWIVVAMSLWGRLTGPLTV